ncbi:MAG TPA: hypothetical protein VGF16_02280 [Bryobacteraceae bacterium]|jgi:hypothetical protein
MRINAWRASLILFLGACLWSQIAPSAPNSRQGGTAANTESKSRRPAPRLSDGKPDFSGIWIGGGPLADLAEGLPKGQTIPLLPAAAKLMSERFAKDDPEANCLPTGIPRIAPYPWTFTTAPGRLYILFEGNIHSYRQIFMDGRSHPTDLNPTWYGHSVGRWEGDTLVIDTVGFNDKFWFDFRGHPHTERLHTVERYTRPDYGTLVNAITIDDPGAYAKPFTVTFSAHVFDGDIIEYICQENEHSQQHLRGPAIPPTPELQPSSTLLPLSPKDPTGPR